jgi:hypothetical protein
MTERGTDIEFDFFEDELPTQEAARTRSRPGIPRRRGTRPPARPPAGLTPLLRLAGLIAFAIVIVVLLVFWVDSCRAEGKRDTYRDYMEAMSAVAADSQQVGRDLNTALTTPGIRPAQLQEELAGLAQQQQQDVARARELEPPGRLREQHDEAIEALDFRAGGLRALADAFRAAADRPATQAGAALAVPMRRLAASDVIWADQFVESSRAVMEAEDIRGVEIPTSVFLASEDLATERLMQQTWQRISGAAAPGGRVTGRHGNGLVSVKALPGGEVLRTDAENIVVATADLAFEVTIENSGESQEVGVGVTLNIQQSPEPINREQTVDFINPGERKTVVFRNLGQIVQFAQKTTVRVEVKAVPGEQNLGNNRAQYSVTFALTPP